MKPQIIFPILFFLLTFIVLGTAMYGYLRKEQDKFIPKDKYDDEVFRNQTKIPIWNVRFFINLGRSDSTSISLGLGVLSLWSLFFLLETYSDYFYVLAATFIGSIAALGGFFIGAFGTFRTRNVSPLMRYGGVILCTIGLINIPVVIFLTIFLSLGFH